MNLDKNTGRRLKCRSGLAEGQKKKEEIGDDEDETSYLRRERMARQERVGRWPEGTGVNKGF